MGALTLACPQRRRLKNAISSPLPAAGLHQHRARLQAQFADPGEGGDEGGDRAHANKRCLGSLPPASHLLLPLPYRL